MLNFNFLNNLQYWGEALQTIETRLPHKLSDYRQSLSPTHMEASIWMIEEVKNYLEEYYLKTGSMRVLILNSWLGLPIVPLLCENIDVSQIHMVDIDDESIELSKLFNKHYSQDKFVNIRHHNLDIPFEFENLNKIEVDLVICMNTEQLYPLQDLMTKNPHAIFAVQNSNIIEEMYGINCVQSAEDLTEQVGIQDVGFSGRITQNYYSWDGKKEYDRFMVIGQKEPFKL